MLPHYMLLERYIDTRAAFNNAKIKQLKFVAAIAAAIPKQ